MDYESFSKTMRDRDLTNVCRFCLAEKTLRRIETENIAQLFEQITDENLSFSPDHPSFICNKCESNLRIAVKIRNDITQIEKCWTQYITEMHVLKEVKVEDVDDENAEFETVEMIIEPVDQMYSSYDADYLEMDSKPDYDCYSYDGDNYDATNSDDNFDENNQEIGDVAKISSFPEKFNCKHCDTTGLSRAQLRVHQKSCHSKELNVSQYVCDICQARYSSRYGIRTHMKRHMQGSAENSSSKVVRRYQCTKCNERFSRKVLLDEHELRHTGGAIHVCHICGISKKTKSLMSKHLKYHDPDYVSKKNNSARAKSTKRYYTCWICPTRIDFQTLDELKTHRKEVHHDFQCQFCKNGFMTKEALDSHLLIHGTQARPHLCKVCGGTFAKLGHLKSHMQGKHAEQKPFPCEKCPKGFVHRYQLESHIRIAHDKIKAFHCTLCPTSFGHAKSRVWHMRTVHKM